MDKHVKIAILEKIDELEDQITSIRDRVENLETEFDVIRKETIEMAENIKQKAAL